MSAWSLLQLLLSAVSVGVGLASPTDDGSALLPSLQPPTDTYAPGNTTVDGPAAGVGDINRNNIFGTSCATGLAFVQGRCVHTEARMSSPPRPQLPPSLEDGASEYDASDDDAFLASLGLEIPLLPAGDDSGAPAATDPAKPASGPDTGTDTDTSAPGVSQWVDSLSDEEFLRELLLGTEDEQPRQTPLPDCGCVSSSLGLALISVGSSFLLLALVLVFWAVVRWRKHNAEVDVTV